MSSDTWPNNLWEELVEEANGSVHCRELVQNYSPPVLYRPALDDMLSQALTERERKVILMRYEQGLTYKAIGAEFGIKQERVRQIVAHARRKLREPRYFNRLWAVPVREVFRCQAEIHALTKQVEQLNEQIALFSKEVEAGKAEKRLQMPLDSPIDALDLSMRSRNRLIAAGIGTVGDLIDRSESDLENIRSLGKVCMVNIKAALARYDYELKPEG